MYAQTIIIGNLTKSPDLKYIPSGTAIAKCSIAYTDGFGDKKTSHFMDIELWGKTADSCRLHTHKTPCEDQRRSKSFRPRMGDLF